jgi:hypothetical protein
VICSETEKEKVRVYEVDYLKKTAEQKDIQVKSDMSDFKTRPYNAAKILFRDE